jgi:hypothetical protein
MDNGCYAESGPLGINWRLLDAGKCGMEWEDFLKQVRQLPPYQLWRFAQAGDLPGIGGQINIKALRMLISANKGRCGFTYTHKSMGSKRHRGVVKEANKAGFVINLSADDFNEADELAKLRVAPVVTLVPTNSKDVSYTPKGRKVVVCPAQTRENVTCQKCRICADTSREYIVGFLPHGNRVRKVNEVAHGRVR